MKPDDSRNDDSRRESPRRAPRKPRVLVPLFFGSIALHLLAWWAIAQLPAPPAKVPEALLEIQLSDFPAPAETVPKAPAPAIRPQTSPLAPAPRAPKTVAPRRAQPAPPTPPRREIAPSAPLVRSTRKVAETGIVAKNPVEKPATAIQPTQNPVPRPQRAPDTNAPRNQKSAPTTEKQSDEISPRPGAGKATVQADKSADSGSGPSRGKGKNRDAGAGNQTKIDKAKGADSGVGNGKSSVAPSGGGGATDKGLGTNKTSSPLANTGVALGNEKGGGGNNSGENRGLDNGNGNGDKSGSGLGPFGLDGATGEGPRHIVYILDISFSMEPRFERAKQELRDALSGLQPGESFNIIAFYGNTRPFDERLVAATPGNIARGRAFIDSLRLSRYTNLERAFEQAFAAPGVNVVVLITDGVPTYGLGAPDFLESDKPETNPKIDANFGELARRVRQLNSARARIYTVGLTGKTPTGTDESFEAASLLQRIAQENGGTFVTVRVDATNQPAEQ